MSEKIGHYNWVLSRFHDGFASIWHSATRPARKGSKYNSPVIPVTPWFWIVVVALMIFMIESMLYFDDDITNAVRVFAPSGSMTQQFFQWVTRLGLSGWILIISAITAIGIGLRDLRSMKPEERLRWANYHGCATFVLFTVAVSGTLASFLKNTIGRARPKFLETLGHNAFDFAAFESSFASFPSGHATTFGALCMCLALLLPRWRWPILIFALLGGISRVVVGAHYISDAAAGLAFGAGFTLLVARYLARRGTVFVFTGKALPARKVVSSSNE